MTDQVQGPRAMPKTRGEGGGMPMDRSGRPSPPKPQPLSRQELAHKKGVNDWLKKRVTTEELHERTDPLFGGMMQLERRLDLLTARLEALLMVTLGKDVEKRAEYNAKFNSILQWRSKVQSLEEGDYKLREIWENIKAWNANDDNIEISFESLKTKVLFEKFMADLDMDKAEKEAFMLDLKFPPQWHAKFLEKFEESLAPKPTIVDEVVDKSV